MRWSSVLSTQTDPDVAIGVTVAAIRDQLGSADADLVLVFASGHRPEAWSVFLPIIRDAYPEATILGCSSGGVIGGGREIEGSVGLSLTAAVLPDVAVVGFHYTGQEAATVDQAAHWWGDHLGLEPEHQPSFLLIPDPFTCDPIRLMAGLDRAFPGQLKVGGLASGGEEPGDHVLVLNDQTLSEGAVGVALYGDIEMSTVVAQGCRPIGPPFVVTRAEKNLLAVSYTHLTLPTNREV